MEVAGGVRRVVTAHLGGGASLARCWRGVVWIRRWGSRRWRGW
ncbi:hypothetical protein HFP72_00060 [Nocardiopsis sp. ARC36]